MKEKVFRNLVNGIDVKVCFSDVCVAKAEACVVPQFSNRVAETGVASTLIHSGYTRAMLDYEEFLQHYDYASRALPMGVAYTTNAYVGCYAWLIHVALLDVECSQAFDTVMLATYGALVEADKYNLHNIVIPALGTGRRGFLSFAQSAYTMLTAVKSFRGEHDTLREITFVISKSEEAYEEFVSYVEKYFAKLPVFPNLREQYFWVAGSL